MNRRNFFKVAGATAVVTSLPLVAHSADDGEHVKIDAEIANNHGHELTLSIVDVVELFAMTNDGETQSLNIQGQSSHPHRVELAQQDLVTLLGKKELTIDSTEVGGHTHTLIIKLDIIEL